MIYLKKKIRFAIKVFTFCLCLLLVFIGSGYFYLSHELTPAETKQEAIPYNNTLPQNAGVIFDICGDRTLCYMNFETETLSIVFDDKNTSVGEKLYGYPADYIVKGDYDLLCGIIDIIGGVELGWEEEILRYTGVQITEKLERTVDRDTLRREIIGKIIEKISYRGFQKEDLLYIIENSETNLTVPDCYYWPQYIKNLATGVRIVN